MRGTRQILFLSTFIMTVFAAVVMADWIPEDGHKMHFPQLPDEAGWDVLSTDMQVVADDWECSETGWVKEIHFWGSWLQGRTGLMTHFYLTVSANRPANPPDIPNDCPGIVLWSKMIPVSMVSIIPVSSPTPQGFYYPQTGGFVADDHTAFYQYNIVLPDSMWFAQEQGNKYWLKIFPVGVTPTDRYWGWKSSADHWNINASMWNPLMFYWKPLYEPPDFTQQLDLAFVINGDTLPQIGACCFNDGDTYGCLETTEDDCVTSYQGSYLGPSTTCDLPQACCLPDGRCIEVYPLCCINELGGTPLGSGSTCSDPVACCLPEGQCQELDPRCCEQVGGTVSIYSTTCLGDMNSDGIDDACQLICDCLPGDPNGDGIVNVADIVYIVAYVFRGGPAPMPYPVCSGDHNGDCTVNLGDAVAGVAYVFKGSNPPIPCENWVSKCGWPIFKK